MADTIATVAQMSIVSLSLFWTVCEYSLPVSAPGADVEAVQGLLVLRCICSVVKMYNVQELGFESIMARVHQATAERKSSYVLAEAGNGDIVGL